MLSQARQNVIALGTYGCRVMAAMWLPVPPYIHGQLKARTSVGPFGLPCLIYRMLDNLQLDRACAGT